MSLPSYHPATDDDVYDLRLFDVSTDLIEPKLRDPQDIVANWTKVGVMQANGRRFAVLVERSSLAVAFVDGDGERFGRVRLPSPREVEEAVRYFGLHWE